MRPRLLAAAAILATLASAPAALAQAPGGTPSASAAPSAAAAPSAPASALPPLAPPPPLEPPDDPANAQVPPPLPEEGPPPRPPPTGPSGEAIDPDDQLRPIGEPETDPSGHRYFPLNVALIYPLAANAGDPNRATNIDLGLLFTKIGYLYGFQTGMLAAVSQEMHGIQLGLGTITEGPTVGAQIAGGFAMADAPFIGLQVAGVFSWSRFRFTGLEISGVANQARKHVTGMQIAGGVNIARKTMKGVQIAGLANVGAIEGIQVAPLNISSHVTGVQIGLINIARKVTGLQIGLINIADEVSGESIGAASLPRAGGVHGVAWGSNSLYGNLGIKFASKLTYSIFSAAFQFEPNADDKKVTDKLIGPGFTFGIYRPLFIDGFYLQADVGGYRLFSTEGPQKKHDEVFKTRLIARYAIVDHLSIFLGGGAYLGLRGDGPTARLGPEIDAGLEL